MKIFSWHSWFMLIGFTMMLVSCGRDGVVEDSSPKPLIVGMELAYPPFEMVDETGNPSGISADLAASLAESLGRPLEIRNIEFSGLIEALRAGQIDCILSSLTATDERREVIDFSDGYVSTGLCLLLNQSVPFTETDAGAVDQLNNPERTIVVKQGTTGHLFAMNSLDQAVVRVLEKEDACVLEVVQGKADAFIYDQLSIYRHWQRHKNATKPILKPFQQESWAIGLQKNSPELKAAINTFLKEFREDGGFEKLAQKYLPDELKAFNELGYPFLFEIE